MEKGNEAAGTPPGQQAGGQQGSGGGTATATDPGTGTGTGSGTQPTSTAGQASGGQQADQSGPDDRGTRWWGLDATDEELVEHAESYENEARWRQEQIDAELAGSSDAQELDYLRERQDRARGQAQRARQELHNRELARPAAADAAPGDAPAGPSGEVEHPGGARTGVDEQGRGYEVDSEGNRSDRERFDQFRPGGG